MEKKTKILLINPPADLLSHKLTRASFPLGICYLGTYLKKNGFDVELFDTQIEKPAAMPLHKNNLVRVGTPSAEIETMLNRYAPDVLGISCNFHTHFNSTLDIAAIAKDRCNIPYVIAGGCYGSVVPERMMRCPHIDFLVIGEGELPFHALLKRLYHGLDVPFEAIDGIAFRKESGEIRVNPKTKFLPSDRFFIPDRDLLPVEAYIRINRPHSILTKGKRTLEVLTSRGCNAKCSFCSGPLLEGKFRARKPEAVIEELKLLKEKYHIDEVQFVDDNLTLDKERAEKIFQLMIDERLHLHWCTPNGIALYALDDHLIEKMAESGCYMAILPVESGSQYVLSKLMRKPLNLGAVPDLVKSFKKYNIALEVFLVIGVPGETFAHIKETFDYIHTLGIFRVHFNYAMPIPSTHLYAQYRALKKDSGAFESNRAEHDEWNFDYRIPVISTEDWTNRELKKFVTQKILQFYIRFIFLKPHFFLKEICKVASHFTLFKEVIRYYGNTLLRR